MHALHFPNPLQPSLLHVFTTPNSFMLAPRTPSAFVCLRCEAQITRRRLPAFARPRSHAKFSASTRRHDDAEELAVPSQAQQPKLKITREVTPLNRLRRKKGGRVIRETANLGVKRLGDDAEDDLGDHEAEEEGQREREQPPVGGVAHGVVGVAVHRSYCARPRLLTLVSAPRTGE